MVSSIEAYLMITFHLKAILSAKPFSWINVFIDIEIGTNYHKQKCHIWKTHKRLSEPVTTKKGNSLFVTVVYSVGECVEKLRVGEGGYDFCWGAAEIAQVFQVCFMSGHTSGLLHFLPYNRVNAQPDKNFSFWIEKYVQLKAFFWNAKIAKVANLAKTKKQIDNLQHLYPGLKGLAKICCETEAVNKAKKRHFINTRPRTYPWRFPDRTFVQTEGDHSNCLSRYEMRYNISWKWQQRSDLPVTLRGNACVYFIEV